MSRIGFLSFTWSVHEKKVCLTMRWQRESILEFRNNHSPQLERTTCWVRIILTNTAAIRAYLRATSKLAANIENMTILIVNDLRKTGVKTGVKRHAIGLVELWVKTGKASSLRTKPYAFRSQKHDYCRKTMPDRRKRRIFRTKTGLIFSIINFLTCPFLVDQN